jgi:phenolic acid decarboxylase
VMVTDSDGHISSVPWMEPTGTQVMMKLGFKKQEDSEIKSKERVL